MESGSRGIIESTFTQNVYRAKKDPEAQEAVYATLPMVLDGASDAFLWFLISNIDTLKSFRPANAEADLKWVYTETALQILSTLTQDHTVNAQNAATALGAVRSQKKEVNGKRDAVLDASSG